MEGRENRNFLKWSHVYTCELIINIRWLHVVLNGNPCWRYLASHFTIREVRSVDQNSDMASVQQGSSFSPSVPQLSHLKMKRLQGWPRFCPLELKNADGAVVGGCWLNSWFALVQTICTNYLTCETASFKSRFSRVKCKWSDSLSVLHSMIMAELTVTRRAFYLKPAGQFSFVWCFRGWPSPISAHSLIPWTSYFWMRDGSWTPPGSGRKDIETGMPSDPSKRTDGAGN